MMDWPDSRGWGTRLPARDMFMPTNTEDIHGQFRILHPELRGDMSSSAPTYRLTFSALLLVLAELWRQYLLY